MKRIGIIVFSPTGTTEQNCMAIAEAIPDSRAEILNITYPGGRQVFLAEPASLVDPYDRIIVGAPVYAGKIPAFAREILEQIPGKGRPATVVAVYGNRDYGIAVKTLADILSASGFVVDSAGAFIGEHSYSEAIPVAVGRPDELDLQKAREFGSRLGSVHQALSPDQIPVQQDMFTRMKGEMGISPRHHPEQCEECGTCAENCPTGIINASGEFISRQAIKTCLGCLSCVDSCPHNARRFEPNFIERTMGGMTLKPLVNQRKEPIYLLGG